MRDVRNPLVVLGWIAVGLVILVVIVKLLELL
jgi:hypothetical protein